MIVYGKNTLKELNPQKIKKVYLNRHLKENSIFIYLKEQKIKFELVDNQFLGNLTDGNHQGIVVEIYDYDYYNINSITDEDFVVVLDHLEDPHNVGAIIRTCECAGIKSIIIPKDRACLINSTVMKVSSGALEKVKIILVSNLVNAINKLKATGFYIYAADMDGTDYNKINYNEKRCLVIGNEGKGLSRLIKENSDFIIGIPLKGKINSLNASVAGGIIIFKMVR